ncbi:MAG: iron uptake porin [Vampirovibrionia bacterium]
MSTKKLVPTLLAASVLVTGFTGAFVYSPSAYGITSVDELSDVDRSSWAFDALRDLVEKYNVIEGYPDKTFRGDHKATRYEMAAALNALIRHIGKDIARLGTEKADKEDLAKLAKLQEEFKAELAALQARTDALEARAAKIEAKNEEQDNRLTVLEKLKIYGDVTIGAFADMGGNGGNGSPFLGNGYTTYGYNGTGSQVATNGSGSTDGFSDGISALGRVRVNIDYPIVEDLDGEGVIGEGTLHTRIIGAYGRVSPMLAGADLGKVGTGSGMLSGVSRVTADASLFNEGVRTTNNQTLGTALLGRTATGSNTRANLYVESAYYTQEFRSGIPILTDLLPGIDLLPDNENWKMSMKMKAGLIPWREIFQQSPYTGDETQQFQNTALVNNAAIPVNIVAPTVSFEWHQGLGEWHSLDVKTALSAFDVSDAMSALAITYEGSLNYNWGWAADWLDLPGNIYAGGWWVNGRGGSNGMLTSNTGFTDRTVASPQELTAAMANNPINTLWAINGPAMTGNLNNTTTFMGLPVGSLNSPTALAAALGITTAQLSNPNTVLPQATINAINTAAGSFYNAANPLPTGTTLAAYYDQFVRQAIAGGVTGAMSQGVLNGGNTTTGTFDDNDNAYGFYVGLNQEIHRGAGLFFSYAVADTGPQSVLLSSLMNGTGANTLLNAAAGLAGTNRNIYGVKSSMNVGLEIPMKALHLPWRHKDVFGIGYAMVSPNDSFGGAYAGTPNAWGAVSAPNGIWVPRNITASTPNSAPVTYTSYSGNAIRTQSASEHIIEAFYKVHLNDRFSVTPNVQFIINRLGDPSNDLMTVIGLRTTFKF